ncbi:23873_t:CDS:2, partial [Gigaspora margarita]
ILRNKKRSAPKNKFIFEEKIKWFNMLKEIARTSNEDDLSIVQSIHSDFNRAKKESDNEIKRWFFIISILNNFINISLSRLREEVEGLRKELEKLKINSMNSVLNSNSMRIELDQKNEYIDILTKQVSELKL